MPFIKCSCGATEHLNVGLDWYETFGKKLEKDEQGYFLTCCFSCWRKLSTEEKQQLEIKPPKYDPYKESSLE